MVVEEIVINVVSYAYPDNPDGYLDVVISYFCTVETKIPEAGIK